MGTITEIEAAIERLPGPEVEELAAWLERFRSGRSSTPAVDRWLAQARGAAKPAMTTDQLMSLTRGKERTGFCSTPIRSWTLQRLIRIGLRGRRPSSALQRPSVRSSSTRSFMQSRHLLSLRKAILIDGLIPRFFVEHHCPTRPAGSQRRRSSSIERVAVQRRHRFLTFSLVLTPL
jgi:hypothetical protein